MLYVIPCKFQPTEHSEPVSGLAICSDPDTPVTFILPNGLPYLGDVIWSYHLRHYSPWTKFDLDCAATAAYAPIL